MTSTPAPTPTPTPISITSATSASFAENGTGTAYQVTTSGGSGTVTYSVSGTDAGAFNISASGALTFKSPPDYEKPTDSDTNNTYLVTITASDNTGKATVNLTVTVSNVADFTTGVQVGGTYTRADHIAAVPGQSKVLVSQRDGNIYLVNPATSTQGTLYLTVSGVSDPNDTGSPAGNRRGLMAVAAAPDYATSGTIYVFVATTTALEIRKYGRTSAGLGDAASADVILRVPFAFDTPNVGGWLGFGSDNLLYATVGSGSVSTVQPNTSLLGKLLRIDPSRDDFPSDTSRDYAIPSGNPFASGGGAAEVFANGFIDPYSAGIDGTTVYIGDQANSYEQASHLYLVRPTDAGKTFGPSTDGGRTPPVILVSPHLQSQGTIVAGNVYRGPASDISGRFEFYGSGGVGSNNVTLIFSIASANLVQGTTLYTPGCCSYVDPGNNSTITPIVTAFGEDSSHNLYYTDGTKLYQFKYQ